MKGVRSAGARAWSGHAIYRVLHPPTMPSWLRATLRATDVCMCSTS